MAALGTVEILERLVACPTVSRDSNLPLIDWVRNFLDDHGVASHLVHDDTGRKSNLFASIGPEVAGGLVLSGHTDVVPVDGQAWSSDPFVLTARGSRLYARGACDMKGFIAAALSRVPALRAAKLTRPVHFMFSYDEEIGCLGAPRMIAAARERIPQPAAVIVGEPTSMRVANEHKGICTSRTIVNGSEAHSSLTHQGVSAVMVAAELITRLGEIARELAARGAGQPSCFVPPYTTVSVNTIHGGTATNILAGQCEFTWDIRVLPGESPERILTALSELAERERRRLEAEGKRCSIETKVLADVPPLAADHGVAEQLARAVSRSSDETTTVPFATEGGQFQRAGWSTVVCGPGSIEHAHKPDEFIERSELQACEAFLDRAIARQCAS
ncbi:MAG TPA: acetylornithine deacetylase [Steroidobacteraceae bacterium]|jgi:acetylornithine deacetylase|nr:acetylornithine deacetylase [Steroidobacteraceae bacterium]